MLGVGAGGPDGAGAGLPGAPPNATHAGVPARDRDALAVLLSVHGLGPMTLGRLVDVAGSPAAVLDIAQRQSAAGELIEASRARDGAGQPITDAVAAAIVEAAGNAGAILGEVERLDIRVVAAADRDYPRRLLAIDVPPPALFVRGSLESLASRHVVAVVGTRHPSPTGRRLANRIGAALARAGATVVSGLAVGIDGAAHAAVLAQRGNTVAFIGGGHARLYPRAHERLADAIVDAGGAVVSEYAPRVEPTKGTFPQRNRLISGAADAVVVVEAGARSGALVTASWALEQGRECFLVPGPIDAPASAGCNGFLRDWHDLARIVSGVPQLLDDLGLLGSAGLPASRRPGEGGSAGRSKVRLPSASAVLSGRSAAEIAVAEALVHGAVTVDEIVAVTRMSVGAVLGAVTRLEVLGLVLAAHGRYEPAGPLAAANPVAA
ncbi:MAG TPA: DNA-processing protein DprA [Candidatus Limnocylindria bacterium]|nr:DNA-processing protein DprA [Candidatus Limnocylindria bacterium]